MCLKSLYPLTGRSQLRITRVRIPQCPSDVQPQRLALISHPASLVRLLDLDQRTDTHQHFRQYSNTGKRLTALHNVLKPSGPFRYSGESAVPHSLHRKSFGSGFPLPIDRGLDSYVPSLCTRRRRAALMPSATSTTARSVDEWACKTVTSSVTDKPTTERGIDMLSPTGEEKTELLAG